MPSIHFESTYSNNKLITGIKRDNVTVDMWAKNVQRRTKGVGQSFNKMGSEVLGSYSRFIAPVGAGLAGVFAFKKLITETYEFEKAFGMAMREVSTISQAVADDFEGVSNKIHDIAANGPDDAIKLAQAFYQIVSAGYDGDEGLKLLEKSSKAATAGITETKTAADGVTTVLNAWKLEASEAGKVLDVMFKTVERGKTTFGELASNIPQVAALAAANKISYNEIFSAVQSLTKQGTSTSEALTQIRSSIIGMNEALGDGWSKTMTYQEGLQAVVDMAGGSQNALKELLGRVEGVNAALGMTGIQAKGAAEDLRETAGAVGSMESAYDKMMDEVDNKWKVVHNRWKRELKELGGLLKEASSSVAELFATILENTQADVIDPGAKKIVDEFEQSISSITDQEEKLDTIVAKIGELRKKRIEELNPKAYELEKGPHVYSKSFEWLLTAINLDSPSLTPGLYREIELENYNEQIKITAQAEKDLLRLYNEVLKSSQDANKKKVEGATEQVRTLKEMLTDLEALEKDLGTGTVADDVATLAKMELIRDEIRQYYQEIREARKIQAPDKLTSNNAKDLFTSAEKLTKETTKQVHNEDKLLKRSKERRVEAQKTADATHEQNVALTKQEVLLENLQEGFNGASEILGAMSYAVGELDDELGQVLGRMADISFNAANLAANLGATGNPITAIASGLGIIGSLFGLLSGSDESYAEKLDRTLKQINETLETQSQLLAQLNGEDWFEIAIIKANELRESVSGLYRELQNLSFVTPDAYNSYQSDPRIGDHLPSDAFIDTTGWSAEDYVKALADGAGFIGEGADSARKMLNSIIDLEGEIAKLTEESFLERLGFDSDSVADTIISGIESGLELSENGLGEWTDKFRDFLSDAGKQAIKTMLEQQFLAGFMSNFQTAMQDGSLEGDLYGDAGLINQFRDGITLANEMWAEFNEGLGDMALNIDPSTYQSGLVGSIRRDLSEETAGELAGITRRSADDTRKIRDYMSEGMDHWAAIEKNTASTVDELKNAVIELQAIKSNTSNNNQSTYDLGVG